MQTVGEFLSECGDRLAPFDRRRVGRLGCAVALSGIVGVGAALWGGLLAPRASLGAGFRLIVGTGLAAVILFFLVWALAETLAERGVRRRIEAFLRDGGSDLPTLRKAAELRQGQLRGGSLVVALLKDYERSA